MSGPFRVLAGEVPRRLLRGWLFWILLLAIALAILVGAAPLGRATDRSGAEMLTFGGSPLQLKEVEPPFHESLRGYLLGLFGWFFAGSAGVLTGLILLADAVTSAFAPGAAELNVPKPVDRATIVLARHAGAVLVAALLATLVVAGGVATAKLRTGELVLEALLPIPFVVASFAVCHAIGAGAAVAAQNALVGAGASIAPLMASALLRILVDFEKPLATMVPGFVTAAVKVLHRVLPRPMELPSLGIRIADGTFASTGAGGTTGELELIANVLLWWGVALGVSVVVVKRRDF